MNQEKFDTKAYIFRAMGEIEDYLIAEAQQYRPEPARSFFGLHKRAAAVALSALVVVTAVFGISRIGGFKSENTKGDAPNQSTVTLSQILESHRQQGDSYTTLSSQSQLPFYNGESYLVWQYADSGELCISRKLKDSEIRDLNQASQGSDVGADSPTLSCKVWIIHADGTVTSPHLKSSPGNTSVGTLFDYEAELNPSEQILSCISNILDRPQ